MKTLLQHMLFLVTMVSISLCLQGQNTEDHLKVQKIYSALQDKGQSAKDVAALTPMINWKETEIPEEVNHRYTITLKSIMDQHWSDILFGDLQYTYPEENKLIVTGIVHGRQHSECEYTSTRFEHSWSFRDGEIIAFRE